MNFQMQCQSCVMVALNFNVESKDNSAKSAVFPSKNFDSHHAVNLCWSVYMAYLLTGDPKIHPRTTTPTVLNFTQCDSTVLNLTQCDSTVSYLTAQHFPTGYLPHDTQICEWIEKRGNLAHFPTFQL